MISWRIDRASIQRSVFMMAALFQMMFVSDGAVAGLNERYLELQQKLEINPDSLELQMDLAYLFTEGLEFQRAVDIYNGVIKKDAVNKRAWIELCALHTQMAHHDDAIVACEKVADLHSEQAWAQDNLGLMYFNLTEYERSFRPFLKALSLNPQDAMVKLHVAQVFLALKSYSAARDILLGEVQNTELKPSERALLFHGLFLAYQKLKDHEKAYEAILETWRLSGDQLYFGKVIKAWMKYHELLTFSFFAVMGLWFSHYFGKRINRFLKNEI